MNATIEFTRGALVENVHGASVAVANASGETIAGYGDAGHVSFPRSALKPIQAVPLIESGAAERFALAPEDIALACASHHGAPMHIARVEAWLAALGLDESALACGPSMPLGRAETRALRAAGVGPARRFHNCSGKHCGFLAGIVHAGEDVDGYHDPAHPAQRRYLSVFSELLDADAAALPWASDGCTLPAVALAMDAMARAAARLVAGKASDARRAKAMARVMSAFAAHSDYASGAGELAPLLASASGGRCLFKTGADGYGVLYVRNAGLGAAFKVVSGDGKARDALAIALAESLGEIDSAAAADIHAKIVGPIENSVGERVGEVRVRLQS